MRDKDDENIPLYSVLLCLTPLLPVSLQTLLLSEGIVFLFGPSGSLLLS